MQRRILVPLDGSPLADRIVQQVRRLLVREDDEVLLLTVVEPMADAEARVRRVQDAQDHLAGLRDALVEQGATASTRVTFGDPASEITTIAEGIGAGLICMATHGRTGLARALRGSVAEEVLRRASVPLLLANPAALAADEQELRFTRLLVPFDGSEEATAVLPLVEDVARLYDAQVLLLLVEHVAEPPEGPRAALNEQARRLSATGIAARALLTNGPVVERILEAAEHERVDLIAMTTHARTGLDRVVLGSVAEQVARRCTWPLLVRRAPAPPA